VTYEGWGNQRNPLPGRGVSSGKTCVGREVGVRKTFEVGKGGGEKSDLKRFAWESGRSCEG